MGKFIAQNGIIAKNNSVITGSLNISGSILGEFFGTASYIITASYVLNSDTASYTSTISVLSSSYAESSTSSSYSYTASVAINPTYAPTNGVGYISPNIYFGSPQVLSNAGNASFNGLLLSPVLITKTCTFTTMSAFGGSAAGTPSCSLALYSIIFTKVKNGILTKF